MKLKIKITEDILRKSMMCGTVKSNGIVTENCAIALAVRDIFSDVSVGNEYIYLNLNGNDDSVIKLPIVAREFIERFDSLTPGRRLALPEFEFEIDVPESIIDKINIDNIIKSETLELVK